MASTIDVAANRTLISHTLSKLVSYPLLRVELRNSQIGNTPAQFCLGFSPPKVLDEQISDQSK